MNQQLNIRGYARHGSELNLANMFYSTIIKAFNKFPNDTMETMATRLGICERTLHRVVKEWNIITPFQHKKKKVKELQIAINKLKRIS